jgi:hypothetical protein
MEVVFLSSETTSIVMRYIIVHINLQCEVKGERENFKVLVWNREQTLMMTKMMHY